jgi:PAS domain S-box-containing protein
MQNRLLGHSATCASVSDEALIHTASSYAPAFLDAIPFPLAVVDLDLCLIGFNNAFRMKFAALYSREPRLHDDIQTLPYYVDQGPFAAEAFSALCQRALKGGAFQISGHYAGTTAGQKARLGFTPVYDPSGAPLMLTISMQDWVTRSEDRSQDSEPDQQEQARRRAEKALTAATNEFQATFDLAPIGMAHIALNGQWLRANHYLCEMLGYSLSELLLLRVHDLTHPVDLDADTVRINELLGGIISSYTLEKRYLHKAGHIIWARLVVSLVREEAGTPKYLIAVLNNISAEKHATLQLERSRARIRAVFDNLGEAVFVFDAAGQVIEANPSAISMFGYADLNEARTRLKDIEKIFAVRSLDAKVLPVKQWPVARVLRGETVGHLE